MYEKLPNLVIGFHGCSKETYENVIVRHENFEPREIDSNFRLP